MDSLTPRKKDHGYVTALALAHKCFADFIRNDTAGPVPGPCDQYACAAPPSAGDEAGCAAVDRWAAANGLTADWKDGAYEAAMSFGPFSYIVFYLPERTLAERTAPVSGDAPQQQAVAA
jgi:hypothetical protein